jgi:hypothetical protein
VGGRGGLYLCRRLSSPFILVCSATDTNSFFIILFIMPFAFWKKFKSEMRSGALSDAAVAKELRAIIPPTPGKMELVFEDHDSGIFIFDEDAEEFSVPSLIDHALATAESTPLMLHARTSETPNIMKSFELDVEELVGTSLLDDSNDLLHTQTASLVCEQPLHTGPATTYHLPSDTKSKIPPIEDVPTHPSVETAWESQTQVVAASIQPKMNDSESVAQYPQRNLSTPRSSIPATVSTAELHTRKRSLSRDSGVYMCDTIDSKPLSQSP